MTIRTFYKNTQTNGFTDEATARETPEIHQRHIITIETMAEVIAVEEAENNEGSGDAPTP